MTGSSLGGDGGGAAAAADELVGLAGLSVVPELLNPDIMLFIPEKNMSRLRGAPELAIPVPFAGAGAAFFQVLVFLDLNFHIHVVL